MHVFTSFSEQADDTSLLNELHIFKHPPITKNFLSLKQIGKILYHLSKDAKMRGDLLLSLNVVVLVSRGHKCKF